MTATKTIYLVTYSNYDIYSIEGSYERREDAETHVELDNELHPNSDLQIEEVEVADGPPRVVYSAGYSFGERTPGNRIVGFAPPAICERTAPEVGGLTYAAAWGYSQEEAMAALDAVLLKNGIS